MAIQDQLSERPTVLQGARRRALIVGCGQLGGRHLQAIASLDLISDVEVVDPRAEGLKSGRALLEETPDRSPGIRYQWLAGVEKASRGGDLCIVATGAAGRCALIQEISEKLGYRFFIVEKLVSQSVQDYEDLLGFARKKKISIWVNCQERTFPIHKMIREKAGGEPITVSETAGNRGLATVGIHGVDNFVFYTGCNELIPAGSLFDPVLHTTKRGFSDLSGTMQAVTPGGSRLVLNYGREGAAGKHVVIVSRNRRWMITQATQDAWEAGEEGGWRWEKIPFEGELRVSRSTASFARQILQNGTCDLPTLEQAFPAHRFVLSEMLPQFNKLLKKKDDLCPVT